MGLIASMAKKQGAPTGVKLPAPTTAGDDQVIAAKTGEYVLPPEVVAAIGVDNLNALVQSITGQAPGGQPAEMPEGPMHEQMEGEAEGCGQGMQGYALGGRVSQFDGVQLNADPLQDNAESPTKYGFQGGMGADSVATEIGRASRGLPAADEVMQAGMNGAGQPQGRKKPGLNDLLDLERQGALGEDSNLMGYNKGGLIARMKGYAEGGLVEDELRRRLSGYSPQSTIRQPEPPFPRANELRDYNPQATIRQPAPAAPAPDVNNLRSYNPQSTIPPNASTNASPRAPELRSFTPEPGRLSPGGVEPRISEISRPAQQIGGATPSRTIAELDARANPSGPSLSQRVTGAQQGFQDARATRLAAEAAAPKPGLIARLKSAPGVMAKGTALMAPLAGFGDYQINDPGVDSSASGVIGNLAAGEGGKAWQGIKKGAVEAGLDSVSGIAKTGDWVAGLVGAKPGLAQAFDNRVRADLGSMVKDGPWAGGIMAAVPAAQASPMTDQERSDEIARRRAALEPPQASTAPTATAAPAAVAAPAARGPVSGLAARAKAAAAPAASASTPPMEGAVEIIRGHNRSWAVPELGYQEVPDEVYRSGKIAEYQQAQANNMMDRADPNAAALRTRLSEINAQGDNQIRVSNATDRDAAGRGLRTDLARLELEQKRREASLVEQAMAGNQEAMARLNMLRSNGKSDDSRARLVTDLVKAYSSGMTLPNMPLKDYVNQGLELATGTVKSNSIAPSAAHIEFLRQNKSNPKAIESFERNFGAGSAAAYLK